MGCQNDAANRRLDCLGHFLPVVPVYRISNTRAFSPCDAGLIGVLVCVISPCDVVIVVTRSTCQEPGVTDTSGTGKAATSGLSPGGSTQFGMATWMKFQYSIGVAAVAAIGRTAGADR